MTISADQFFNAAYMKENFDRKIRQKKGGGRDHLTPEKFLERYGDDFGRIAKKCLDGTYRFSFYNEKLMLKGAGKYPRVISIPSIRDRLVLGVLNEYLSAVFDECVSNEVPNSLIKRVFEKMNSIEGKVYFLRTDFHDFYGSISIKILKNVLSSKISDENMTSLIYKAVTTPTISGHKPTEIIPRPKYGIPQGLAISNILASIYMKAFDDEYGNKSASLYIRYVDDILFLNPLKPIHKRPMVKELQRCRLHLRLSPDKCKKGIVGKDKLEFLGYVIKDKDKVFVREKNVTRFLSRVAALAAKFRDGYKNPYLRPLFIQEESAYVEYYIAEFNHLISGFKYEHRPFGWMAYFQTITDVASLYGMDRIIRGRLLDCLDESIKGKVNTLVDTYYAIRREGGGNLVEDYDAYTTTGQRRSLLLRRGRIKAEHAYSDEQIDHYFYVYMDFLKKRSEQSIGGIS